MSPGLIDPYVTVSRLSGVRPAAPDGSASGRRGAGTGAPPQTPPRTRGQRPSVLEAARKERLNDLRVSPEVRDTFRDLGFTIVAAVPDKGILRGESASVALSTGRLARRPRREIGAARRASADTPSSEARTPAPRWGSAAAVRPSPMRVASRGDAAYAAKPPGRAGTPERMTDGGSRRRRRQGAGRLRGPGRPCPVEGREDRGRVRAEGAPRSLRERPHTARRRGQAAKPDLVLSLAFRRRRPSRTRTSGAVSLQHLRAWDRARLNHAGCAISGSRSRARRTACRS